MKTMRQFVAVVLFLSCSVTLTAQRPSPCLCNPILEPLPMPCNNGIAATTHSMPATPSEITPASNKVDLEIRDEPSSLDNYEDARYQAFWIWGDGNFRHFRNGLKEDDLKTYKQSYNYSAPDSYVPVVVLIEKKSNKQPPGRTERNVKISNMGTGTTMQPDTFWRRLNPSGKSADIYNIEQLRADSFHTAIVVSARKSTSNLGVFFFYNSIYNKRKNTYKPEHVHDVESVEIPNYVKRAGLSLVQGTMADLQNNFPLFNLLSAPGVFPALEKSFGNFMFLPVSPDAIRNMPLAFDEYRFFPILETVWPDTLSAADFMTIVVGTQSPLNDDIQDPFYDEQRISTLSETLSSFLAQFDTTGNPPQVATTFRIGIATDSQGNSSQAYVTGADRLGVTLVGSIDPNELEVKKICPIDSGKYKVTMRLQICNEGYMFENSIGIRLIDAGRHFSKLTLPEAIESEISSFREEPLVDPHQWSFTWAKHLDGIYNPANPNDEYAPSCASFEFTIETDWAGVQKLQTGEALEMCVTFSLALTNIEDCSFNFPIKGPVTQITGFACGDDSCSCNWLCWLLIILVVLLLLWWWWYKKQQDNNNA